MFRCELCQQATAGPDWLCADCRADLPWLTAPHCRCGLPPHSGPCPLPAGAPQAITAPFAYQFPLDQLVSRYKHQRCRYSGRLLAQLATHHSTLPGQPDMLVPVPLHWRRLLRRGFNQSEALAAALSRRHAIAWHPLLTRQHSPAAQQQLSRDQRRRNLVGAFHCHRTVKGLRICLVDDVATTGSTLAACAAALREAGAAEVSAWCLARTLLSASLS